MTLNHHSAINGYHRENNEYCLIYNKCEEKILVLYCSIDYLKYPLHTTSCRQANTPYYHIQKHCKYAHPDGLLPFCHWPGLFGSVHSGQHTTNNPIRIYGCCLR